MSIDDCLSAKSIVHLMSQYGIPDDGFEIIGKSAEIHIYDSNRFNSLFANLGRKPERKESERDGTPARELYVDYKGWYWYALTQRNVTRVRHR